MVVRVMVRVRRDGGAWWYTELVEGTVEMLKRHGHLFQNLVSVRVSVGVTVSVTVGAARVSVRATCSRTSLVLLLGLGLVLG